MTTENIQINIREDGARVVVVNIQAIANASASANSSINGLNSTLNLFRTALGGLGIAATIREFVSMADAVVLMEARLRLATKTSENFNQAQIDIYNAAQRNNVGLRETANLYTKLFDPIQRLGGGTKEVAAIVESFATALRVGGASATEAASATLQFSQAMGKGKLDGDEFRTMAENAPRVMRAMADSMGVPVGALKGMSTAGKLTADVMGNALIKALEKLRVEALTMKDTVGGAFTRLTNDTVITVGAFDKLTGTSAGMADAIGGVALVVKELGKAFTDELADGTKQTNREFDSMGLVIRVVGTALETVLLVASSVAFTFGLLGREIAGIAGMSKALANGDLEGARNIRAMVNADNATAVIEMERYQARIASATDKALKAREAARNGTPAGGPVGGMNELNRDKGVVEKELGETLDRLSGISKTYKEDLFNLSEALKANLISEKDYAKAVKELEEITFKRSRAGREAAAAEIDRYQATKKGRDDALLNVKTAFDREANLYSAREKMLDTYHNRFNLSDSDYYEGREVARREFEAAEKDSFARETAIINNFKPKNQAELVANKQKYDQLLRQHLDFTDQMNEQRSADSLNQMADANDVTKASQDGINEYLSSQQQVLDKLREANVVREESKSAMMNETNALYELAIANLNAQLAAPDSEVDKGSKEAAQGFLDFLTQELNIRKEITAEYVKQENLALKNKAASQAIKDWKEVGKSISESLGTAFGKIGQTLGNVFKSYSEGMAKQFEIQKRLDDNTRGMEINDPRRIEEVRKANQASAQEQLSSYGQMTQAAAGFFDEQSTGYKVLTTMSQVFHAAELAMTMAELVPKAISAVLNQANGDPYSAFARMAAMAAIVAGLGVAIGSVGGTSVPSSKQRQEAAGKGSVFGDPDAKSQSLSNSLEIMERNSSFSINQGREMIGYLRIVANSMSNLTNIVLRTAGISGTGEVPGVQTGTKVGTFGEVFGTVMLGLDKKIPILGKVLASLFGTTTNVVDQGIVGISRSLAGIESMGFQAQSYADVQTKKRFLGVTYSDKTKPQYGSVPSDLNDQITLIIKGMADSIKAAAGYLGVGGDAFTQRLNSFVVNIGEISTKGLTGEQIQKQFEAVFSKLGDDMARFAFDGFQQFQKVGEGYFETLTRVASEYMALDSILLTLGKTFGKVGLDSLVMRNDLILLSGGIEKLAERTESFRDKFLTELEKSAFVTTEVSIAMAALGQVGITTMTQFKQLVMAQDLTTEGGRKLYARLLEIADAFAAVEEAQAAALKARTDIEIEILQAQQNEYAATALMRREEIAALQATNPELVALKNSLYAIQDAATSQGIVDRFTSAGKAVTAALTSVASEVMALADRATTTANNLIGARNDISNGVFAAQDKVTAAQGKVDSLNKQAAASMLQFAASVKTFLTTLNTGAPELASTLLTLKAQFSSQAVLAAGGDKGAQTAFLKTAGDLVKSAVANSSTSLAYGIEEAAVKTAMTNIAEAIEAQNEAAAKVADPMVVAQKELLAAEEELIRWEALAAATNSSIDRSSMITAGSTTALLAAYDKAFAEDKRAQADLATALRITANLNLSSVSTLDGLRNSLITLGEAQGEFIKARNDLATYIINIETSSGNLDKFIENLTKGLGLTGEAADALKEALKNPATAAKTLAEMLGDGGIFKSSISTLSLGLTTPGTAIGTLITDLAKPNVPLSDLASNLGKPTIPLNTLATDLAKPIVPLGDLVTGIDATKTPLDTFTTTIKTSRSRLDDFVIDVYETRAPLGGFVEDLGDTSTPLADLTTNLAKPTTPLTDLTTGLGKPLTPLNDLVTHLGKPNTTLVDLTSALGKPILPIDVLITALKGTGGAADVLAGQLDSATMKSSVSTLIANLGLVGDAAKALADLMNNIEPMKPPVPPVTTPTGPGTSTPTPPVATIEETFITNLYKVILDRMPDAGGLKFWVDQLKAGGITYKSAADDIAFAASQLVGDKDLMGTDKWNLMQSDIQKGLAWLEEQITRPTPDLNNPTGTSSAATTAATETTAEVSALVKKMTEFIQKTGETNDQMDQQTRDIRDMYQLWLNMTNNGTSINTTLVPAEE